MRNVTNTELGQLAQSFGLSVDDDELDTVRAGVDGILAGTDAVFDLDDGSRSGPETRSWETPADDPHNALVHTCTVLPAEGHTGLLESLRFGIKDNIPVAGVPMTCGSEMLAETVASVDATVVERLRANGARIVVKTNMDEFAASGTGTHGSSKPIRNPHDLARTAGGSSGGSAVAVATGQVEVALGTDTGGSVRIPSSYCGVFGLKPTYGLVPITDVFEAAYTLDHVGILSNTLENSARTLEAMAGSDPDDVASVRAASSTEYEVGGYLSAVESPPDPSSIAVGVVEDGYGQAISDSVTETVENALGTLSAEGVTIERCTVPDFSHSKPIYAVINAAEIADNWLNRGVPYRRGTLNDEAYQAAFAQQQETESALIDDGYRSKILAGAALMRLDGGRSYVRAQQTRAILREQVDNALSDVDVLALPTMPDVAPPHDRIDAVEYPFGHNTRFANLTTHPALTLPCGTVDGLPVGIQLIGNRFDETMLYGVGKTVVDSL